MSTTPSAGDYPEHLNPFDDNYDEQSAPEPATNNRQKYNTWGAQKEKKVSTKPTFLERPWTALNITPKSKLVRRLSLLKTTVERMSFRRKRTQPPDPLPRSHSIHNDMTFRIISPKVKAKLREQAIPALARLDSHAIEATDSPEVDCRVSPAQSEGKVSSPQVTSPPDCPEVGVLTPRPTPRKKKRPPPPPPPAPPQTPPANKELQASDTEKPSEDNISTKSSITQDLEKDVPSEDDSLADFEFDQHKLYRQYD